MNILIIFGAKYLYLVSVFIVGYYFFKQPKAVKKRIIILGIISLPITYAVAKIAGLFYYDTRPFIALDFTPLIPHSDDNGFPSDHTLFLSAIASLVYFFNKKISILLWVIALTVGFARVFAGVHHSIDIFGSIAIVVIVSVLVNQMLKNRGIV